MRKLLKKFSVPILIIFWSYTWHAYAVGSLDRKDLSPETPRTILKQDPTEVHALIKIQNKTQFKRRPFIAKGDVIILKPFELGGTYSSGERSIPVESFVFCTPSEQTHLLRSPPALI